MDRTVVLWLFVVLAGSLVGCQGEGARVPVGVADSAGVRIVQLGELGPEVQGIRLPGEPTLRVGWGPDEYQFANVIDGVLLSDGSVVVADLMNREAVLFGPEGELLGALGMRGQGPGEVGSPNAVAALPDDSVLVQDDMNGRFTLFHSGHPVRSFSDPTAGALRIIGVLRGKAVLRTGRYHPQFRDPWLKGHLALLDVQTGVIDTLLAFDMVQNRRSADRFEAQGVVGVTTQTVLLGRSDRAEVRSLGADGRVRQVVRWEADYPRVSEEDWAVYEHHFMTDPVVTVDSERMAELFSQMRPPIGEPLPHFGKLFGDDEGRTWAGAYSTNWRITSRFEVFDSVGTWLGSLDLGRGMQVLDIRDDQLLAVEFDEMGVASAVVYDVLWSG